MRWRLRDYAIAVASYVALIAGGLVITLTISSAVGYLPYSDRPGPGWTEPSFSFPQLGFYLSWSIFLVPPAVIYGTVIFGYMRVLRVFDAPPVILRVVGALTAATVSFVIALGAGWYISMAAFPAFVSAALGAGWGAVLLPRCLGPRPATRPTWLRWTASTALVLTVTGDLYWVFFAPRYTQNLHVNVVRTGTRERAGRGVQRLEPHEAALLDSILPNAPLEYGLTGWHSTGNGLHDAGMLIVVTGPLNTEARLREPKGVSVVYVQRGDEWEMFPPNAPTIKRLVRIGPGSKPNEVMFAWPGSDASTFTWAPN